MKKIQKKKKSWIFYVNASDFLLYNISQFSLLMIQVLVHLTQHYSTKHTEPHKHALTLLHQHTQGHPHQRAPQTWSSCFAFSLSRPICFSSSSRTVSLNAALSFRYWFNSTSISSHCATTREWTDDGGVGEEGAFIH